ncbi:MAG TPA: DUF885 family protein [Thermoanaerobaculia bacterium]
MRYKLFVLLAILALASTLAAAPSPAGAPQTLASRRKALESLFAEQWNYTLSSNPELASTRGDRRWNDKVSDLSPRAVQEDEKRTKQFLARLKAIDSSGLPEQEALTRTLLERRMEETLDNARFKAWEMPVTPLSGIHLQAIELVPLLPFETAKDYDDYIARLRQLPRQFDDTIAIMRLGMADRLMPPKFLLEKVASQAEGVAAHLPDKTVFAGPLAGMGSNLSESEQKRIHDGLLAVIGESVLPAYRRFGKFVREEYAPRGRADAGLWSLPDGPARYAAAVRRATTTPMTPGEIHELGLAQVTQAEAQIAAIAKKLGFTDSRTLAIAVESNPKLKPQSGQEVFDRFKTCIATMGRLLPSLFGRRPRAGLEVGVVPASRQAQAPAAEYRPGSKDGTRLARLWINPASPEFQRTITIERTAYHEGVPGHHMEAGIAQELPDVPAIRREARYGAFSEGWAIYAERLARDVGFYADPYSDYGRAREELLRGVRMVVDTGLHLKGWTREQAAQYLRDHGGLSDADAQVEIERMICRPAEALAYEVGALRLLGLRERARQELGPRFRLASFHDAVLAAGSIPIDLLEERINRWIEQEKARPK